MISFNDLVVGFKKLGLKQKDIVLVHSSFKSFGGVMGGPQTVIDALCYVITDMGTLIVPTFNFNFCEGEPFDVMNTPSQMGVITELVRKNPNSKRTLHPVYSFSIMGKLRDTLSNLNYESSYGKDSIFAKLRDLDGKIMIIGLPYNKSMTFFHHIEEMEGCDYRYFKEFKGQITDYRDTKEGKAIIFVRDLERGVITQVDKMGKILEKEKIVSIQKIGNSVVRLMKVNDVYKRTVQEMKKNPHILCEIHSTNLK